MIALEDVCAGYGGAEVLHGVSFALEKGERLSIIGPNGCGKTTLLRAIAGVLPYTGKVLMEGIDPRTLRRKQRARQIALLSQLTQVQFGYTVMETVMMGRYPHMRGGLLGASGGEDAAAAQRALAAVHMLGQAGRPVDELSGGQLQRVMLAKAIAQEPDLVLLDEPTNHLDLASQVELVRFLGDWSRDAGKTVIGVMHDVNLALRLSDRVLLMENGRVRAYGAAQEVMGSDALPRAYGMDVVDYRVQSLKRWETIAGRGRPK